MDVTPGPGRAPGSSGQKKDALVEGVSHSMNNHEIVFLLTIVLERLTVAFFMPPTQAIQ